MFYHQIKIRDNVIIYVPSSIPNDLLRFIDTNHLIKNKELVKFKQLVKDKMQYG